MMTTPSATTSLSPSAAIDCGVCVLRPFEPSDAASLAELANDHDVWINLRDRFPHPYELKHAEAFIADAATRNPLTNLAVCVDDRVVGSIGIIPGTDIERVSGEIGYWLGKPYWGRGIMTAALKAATPRFAEQLGLTRVFAAVFTFNVGSARILEKAGYVREAYQRQAAIKEGVVYDQYVYAWHPRT